MSEKEVANRIIYQKLVRDKIPDIIRKDGKTPFFRQINGQELTEAISEKILEEAFELFAEIRKENRENVLKESADVLEVILAALRMHGFDVNDLLSHADARRETRGGFSEQIFLDQVDGGELCEIEFQRYPEFVFNPFPKGKLISLIRTELERSISARIASAFYSPGPTNLMVSEFSKYIQRGGNLKILLSTMGNITQPRYLSHLSEYVPENALKVFHPPNLPFNKIPPHFHVKAWLFEHPGGNGSMLIGSSNFTQGGLINNIEWNYFSSREINISFDNKKSPFQSAVTEFERLWENEAVRITEEFLAGYRMRYHEQSTSWKLPPAKQSEIFDPQSNWGKKANVPEPTEAQEEALENLAIQRDKGIKKAAVIAATGLGKTYLAAFDYRQSECKSILFIAHREDILVKAREVFRKVLGDQGFGTIFGRGNTEIGNGKGIFAMIQTLSRTNHLENFFANSFEYLVIDEFHHSEAAGYQKILTHFQPDFLLGLTATPERMDGRNVLAYCDHNIAYEVRVLDAINRGWLAPFQYFAIYDEIDYEQIPWRGTKYDEVALDKALQNDTRTAIIAHNLKKFLPASGKPKALAFCSSVSHARFTAEKLTKDHGIPALALWGESSDEERHAAVERLEQESNDLNVICTVDLFNEGTDIPALTHILFLRPTQSFTLFLQQLGRGLRTFPNKDFLVVLDFIGNFKKVHTAPLALSGYTSVNQFAESKPSVRKTIEQRLPEGCYLNADLEVQRIWDAELRRIIEQDITAEDRLKLIYQDIKSDLGKEEPLRLMDMLSNAYDVDPYLYIRKFGNWLRAVKACENEGLPEAEDRLIDTPGEYLLHHIEAGLKSNRSYKMVVLLSLLQLGGLNWRIEDIAQHFLNYYLNNPDHMSDYEALSQSEDPQSYKISSVVAHLKRMPLDKLSNTDDDCFILNRSNNTFKLKPEYEDFWRDPFFKSLVKDRTEFVLARYFIRSRLQQIIYFNSTIFTDGFLLNRKFAEELYADNPIAPGQSHRVQIFIGAQKFNAELVHGKTGNEFRISYSEDSPIAEFLRKTLNPVPKKDEKAFTLVAAKNDLRIEIPMKMADFRGIVVDIPYAKKPEAGITAEFRGLFSKTPNGSEWEKSFENAGYGGSMDIEVIAGDAFRAWTGSKFQDKSRFPARIKAAATALMHEGLFGEFNIVARGKRVFIKKI